MKITPTSFAGLFILEPQRLNDSRGFFARTWSREDAQKYNLDDKLLECSLAYNKKKGTLRGLHYQRGKYAEVKLIRCTMGKVFDVVVDIRPKSKTYQKHFTIELSAENRIELYIPKGFAHGYQTLEDKTELFYQIGTPYMPNFATGIRFDDPVLDIDWPLTVSVISDRDKMLPFLNKHEK